MSLRAVTEIVVHLESFRNIDLFYQGLYYIRFRIFSRKKIPLTPAEQAAQNQA